MLVVFSACCGCCADFVLFFFSVVLFFLRAPLFGVVYVYQVHAVPDVCVSGHLALMVMVCVMVLSLIHI